MKQALIPIIVGSLIGFLVPTFFIYLDLNELEMVFDFKNILWDINSQRILKFSVTAFPIIFALAGYFYSREKALQQKLNKEEAENKRNSHLASIGEMTSSVAHEINNPLAIISGSALVIQRRLEGEFDVEELKNKVGDIRETCDRISKIIRSMQDITRDTSEEDPTKTTLGEVIGDVTGIFEEKIKGSDIDFKFELKSPIFQRPLLLKRISLSRVFINLLNNSVDAIKESEEKWIKIFGHERDGFYEVLVQDSGSGIALEIVERLFEPFFTSKDIGKGTGLGLSLSQKVVRDEGGDLYYDDSRKNTTFVVKIPSSKAS